MKEYQLTHHTLEQFFNDIQGELATAPLIIVTTKSGNTGKWGMARLWRSWMATTAKFMAGNGVTQPLMISPDGKHYGQRPFNQDDAHELFTYQWLGCDQDGKRLSWAKQETEGRRPATKGERFMAMLKHENYCVERGILLMKPNGSEYDELTKQQDQ